MLVGPAQLLGLLWNPGVGRLRLALPFCPLGPVWVGSLVIKIGVVLDVL